MSFFDIKRLVGTLVQPIPVILVLLLLAFFLLLRSGLLRHFLGLVSLALAVTLFVIVSLPSPVRIAARELESQYSPVLNADDVPYEPAYIAVLGNQVEHPDDSFLPGLSRLSHTARARLVEGVRLAQLFPQATMILCGYGRGLENCAHAMRDAAIELGISADRIELADKARDTQEEAMTVCSIAGSKAIAVVTTAVHMERAMMLFADCGATVIPSPCDFIAPKSDETYAQVMRHRWNPRGASVTNNEKTWHELMGLTYLWLRGDNGEDE